MMGGGDSRHFTVFTQFPPPCQSLCFQWLPRHLAADMAPPTCQRLQVIWVAFVCHGYCSKVPQAGVAHSRNVLHGSGLYKSELVSSAVSPP